MVNNPNHRQPFDPAWLFAGVDPHDFDWLATDLDATWGLPVRDTDPLRPFTLGDVHDGNLW
jgi:hypothetical protein